MGNVLGKSKKTRTYTCEQCSSIFLAEDLIFGNFFEKDGLCARCIVLNKVEDGDLDPPRCFGRSYDAGNNACRNMCNLKNACMIQFLDDKIERWEIEELRSRVTQIDFAIRILKAIGGPIHVRDLSPILSHVSGGIFNIQKKNWYDGLKRNLRAARDRGVVYMGEGYFIWEKVWPLDEEEFGKPIKYSKRKDLIPYFQEVEY